MAMTGKLAGHRVISMTFVKRVKEKTQEGWWGGVSSGKPHCVKGTPVSCEGVVGIAGA